MKMLQVTIHTGNMAASLDFYQQVAGLIIQNDMRDSVGEPIVFLADAAGDVCVELIERGEPYAGHGLSIGFRVDDVEAYREQLLARGLQPTPIISPLPQVKFFFVRDPNGLTVQFM